MPRAALSLRNRDQLGHQNPLWNGPLDVHRVVHDGSRHAVDFPKTSRVTGRGRVTSSFCSSTRSEAIKTALDYPVVSACHNL
jgi:hypothetical protein